MTGRRSTATMVLTRNHPQLLLFYLLTAICFAVNIGAQSDRASSNTPVDQSSASASRLTDSKPSVLVTTPGANGDVQPISNNYVGTGNAAENDGSRAASLYRVGVGDVISIRLRGVDVTSKELLVRRDGTIEYSLVGDFVPVAGKTVNEIAALLTRSVKLVADPELDVTVVAYNSHSIEIKGDVESPGIRYIRREAIPLFVLRSESIADPRVNTAIVTREEDGRSVIVKLGTTAGDGFLVFPGSSVEFRCKAAASDPRYFKLSRNGSAPSTHELKDGTTLMSAIADGGPASTSKKVLIRRTAVDGKMSTLVFRTDMILSGKVRDPLILDGDLIEIQ